MEISISELQEMLEISYDRGLSMYIRGGIGIGKSETVQRFAKEKASGEKDREYVVWNDATKEKKQQMLANPGKYFAYIDQRTSSMDLGDFKLPKFDNGGFEWCIPVVYSYLCKEDTKAVLFLDEFNLAPPSIQGMFYSIINDRNIGENRLGKGVYVVGAGNRMEDKAAVYEMSYPLRNRFMHVELGNPGVDDWASWASNNGVDMRIITFLKFKPSLLYKPEFNGEYSFGTPRSWARCSNGIKGINKLKQLELVAAATVGEGAAIELVAHIKLIEKVDLDELMEHPEKMKAISEPQMFFSIAGGMVEKYKSNSKNLKKIVCVGDNMRPEYSIWMFKMIKEAAKGQFKGQMSKATKLEDFAEKYGKFLLD